MHDIMSRTKANEVRARITEYTSSDLTRAPQAACDDGARDCASTTYASDAAAAG
jgi:hypothetical protein